MIDEQLQGKILTMMRNLLDQPGDERLRAVEAHLSRFGDQIHPHFTPLIGLINEYKRQSGSIPNLKALILETQGNPKEEGLHKLIVEISQRPIINEDSSVFISAIRRTEVDILLSSITDFSRLMTLTLSPAKLASIGSIDECLSQLIGQANRIRDLARRERDAQVIFGAGQQAVDKFYTRVEEEEEIVRTSNDLFYSYGIDHFDAMLRIWPGDLMVVGGFTSHGKSVELRRLTYHLVTQYAANVHFLTFESTAEELENLFLLRHANNKEVFPNTPPVTKDDFILKKWTPPQRNFFLDVVVPDWYHGDKYGVIKIIYPNKVEYRLEDWMADVSETERNEMPVDAMVGDYLTKMWPMPVDARRSPEQKDYNLLFSRAKQAALTHKDARTGLKKPIPLITAAQISRKGLDEAIKNNLLFEEKSFGNYAEIERASDTLTTVMMTKDMRDQQQTRIQHIKGRKTGIQTEPLDVRIDLAGGEQISTISTINVEQLQRALDDIL